MRNLPMSKKINHNLPGILSDSLSKDKSSNTVYKTPFHQINSIISVLTGNLLTWVFIDYQYCKRIPVR